MRCVGEIQVVLRQAGIDHGGRRRQSERLISALGDGTLQLKCILHAGSLTDVDGQADSDF